MRYDEAYADAVRTVVREVFAELAAARGLRVPPGVLAVAAPPDPTVLADVRARVRRPRGDGVEQLGYAFESLLGREDRRHEGAHYTPLALADEVVAHALEPLVRDVAPEQVAQLRVLDIATGSGVFLVSAARFLASRHGDGPGLVEVISSCLYGADVNPTAVEVCRLSLWLLAADPDLPVDFLDDRIVRGDSLVEVAGVGDRQPVSWPDLAPGVIAAGGFDAVIGNPPFLGVKNIRSAVGKEVRDHYAATLLGGASGRSDLVVFFLAQALRLSRNVVGLVVPDAIAEGDSARFGPGRALEQGYRIYRAETSRPWPSAAGVRIALLWLQRTALGAGGPCVLDGVEVPWIGPHLGRGPARTTARTGPPPWMPHGYQATIVLGKSLVLTPTQAADLVGADARAQTWLRPYLSGDDLVSTPGPTASRWVLDAGRTDLAALREVPPIARLLERVRVERDLQLAKYPQLADRWWGFLNPVDRLYDALAGRQQAIALSKHAKYIWPVLVATGPVFSNGTIVYPSDDPALYAFLASTPHRLWAVDEGGSRLNQSHRYNPSRLLATYPFPDSFDGARDAGEQLADAVAAAQAETGAGVTEVLNRVHGGDDAAVVAAVRNGMVAVDRAVLAAHGITTPFEHALWTRDGRTRFGIDAPGERAIKDALAGS